jgi:hypothetical protein
MMSTFEQLVYQLIEDGITRRKFLGMMGAGASMVGGIRLPPIAAHIGQTPIPGMTYRFINNWKDLEPVARALGYLETTTFSGKRRPNPQQARMFQLYLNQGPMIVYERGGKLAALGHPASGELRTFMDMPVRDLEILKHFDPYKAIGKKHRLKKDTKPERPETAGEPESGYHYGRSAKRKEWGKPLGDPFLTTGSWEHGRPWESRANRFERAVEHLSEERFRIKVLSYSGNRVNLYIDPTFEELEGIKSFGEVRAWLDSNHCYAWDSTEALHYDVKEGMGLADAVPVALIFDRIDAVIIVTDAVRTTKWHHNPQVAEFIRRHPYISRMWDTVVLHYYDEDVVGDWEEL